VEISLQLGTLLVEPSDLAALASFEDTPLPIEIADLIEAGDFVGRVNQTVVLYPRGTIAPRRLLLIGLGKRDEVTNERLRQAGAIAVRQAQTVQAAAFNFAINGDAPVRTDEGAQALTEGILLGAYRFLRFRTGLTDAQKFAVEKATIFIKGSEEQARAGIAVGQAVARGVIYARDLVNNPGSVVTPKVLADEAVALGGRLGMRVLVLDKPQLTSLGFGGILAVGQGSANDPRFIVIEYGSAQEGKPTICLVGKGVTFDSGGLSLKPPEAMETMKSDKAGAATVIGAIQAAAELKLPLHVVALVCAAENMPSSTAFRPGDLITTLSGKTIEVLNTDAEGRIILADGLHYAQRYNPTAIIEVSTLTGAIIIALGSHATGMIGTDQPLMDRLSQAAAVTGEQVWQLPLWQEYRDMVKSEVADVKNLAGRPAGSITAAAFLAEFAGNFPFAHLDIAGTAWTESPSKPYETRRGTGVGVRLLVEVLRGYTR
jgi:leucyl aminopeptidase